jgi:hypothetical protein
VIDNGSIGFERTITDFEGNGGIKKGNTDALVL